MSIMREYWALRGILHTVAFRGWVQFSQAQAYSRDVVVLFQECCETTAGHIRGRNTDPLFLCVEA